MPTWLDGIIGNWQLSMTGRFENGRLVDIGTVKLVNMTLNDVQQAFHYYRNTKAVTVNAFNPSTGTFTPFTTVPDGRWYGLPQDIIVNSTKAWSVANGNLNGYATCTGTATSNSSCGGPDPNSRFFAPQSTLTVDSLGNTAGCSSIFNGGLRRPPAVPRGSALHARGIQRQKAVPFARRGSFDVEIDALNLFNAIDFNSAFSATGGSNIISNAYQDISNTFDPGGRLLQLVFRVNW